MTQLDMFAPARQLDLFAAPPPPAVLAQPAPRIIAPGTQNETEDEYTARRRRENDEWRREWDAFQAMVARGIDRETLVAGDRARRRDYFQLDVIRLDDGWHYRRDYSFSNGGGGGPYGRDAHPTRDDAVTAALRLLLRDMARDTATGTRGYPPAWRTWALEVAPPALFGGADLAAEYDALLATYRQRNALRCAALRAGEREYVDEKGERRSVTSL